MFLCLSTVLFYTMIIRKREEKENESKTDHHALSQMRRGVGINTSRVNLSAN